MPDPGSRLWVPPGVAPAGAPRPPVLRFPGPQAPGPLQRAAPSVLDEQPRYAPLPERSYAVQDDGSIRVDPAKKDITPFWLVSEPEEVEVPAAVDMGDGLLAGGAAENPTVFPIDNKGPVEIAYSSFHARFLTGPAAGQPTDQFMVVFFDPEMRPVLMNREVHASTIAGGWGDALGTGFNAATKNAAGRPLVWPETFFMEPENGGKALMAGFRNLTTERIAVRWAFHGVRYYHLAGFEKALKERERLYGKGKQAIPYFYTTDTDVRLEPGASFEFDMRITDEADLEIFKATKFSDFDFLSRLQEKAGKRHLDSAGLSVAGGPNGVHSSLMWGTGEFPFIYWETLYLEQNYKIMLVLTSLGTYPNRIFPTFICRKIEYARDRA